MMPIWVVGAVAVAVGIAVGFIWRGLSAGTQKALLEQSNRDLTDALNVVRSESAPLRRTK